MMIEISPKNTDNRRHKSSTSLSSSLFQYSRSERKLDTIDKNTFSTTDIIDHKLLKADSRCSEFKDKLDLVKHLKKAKKKGRAGSLTHLTRVSESAVNKDLASKKSSGHKVHALNTKDKSSVYKIPRIRKAGESAAHPAFRRTYVNPDELQQHAMVRQMQQLATDERQVMKTETVDPRLAPPKKIRQPKKIMRYMTRLKEHDDIKEEDQNHEKHPYEFSQKNTPNKETLKPSRKLDRNTKFARANSAHAAKQDELEEALFNERASLVGATDQAIGDIYKEQQLLDTQHRPILELFHNKTSGSCRVASERRSPRLSTDARHNFRGKRFEEKARLESKYQSDGRFERNTVRSKKNPQKYNTSQLYNLDTDLTEVEDEIPSSNDVVIPTLPLSKRYRRNHWNTWPRHSPSGKFTFSSLVAPRRYELPTIASKMKQVDNRMLMGKSDIPFVTAKSTSPSHNIGMNLQKLMADIKINNAVTGIPLSLALRMGLKLGLLKVRSRRKYHRLVTHQPRSREMGVLRVGARSVPLHRTMSFGRLLRLCGDGDGIIPRYLRSQGRSNCYNSSFTLNQELDCPWKRYTEKSEPGIGLDELVTDPNSQQYNELREVEPLDNLKSKSLTSKMSKEFVRRQARREAEEYISKMKDVGAFVTSNS